jgi:hypothetical protein
MSEKCHERNWGRRIVVSVRPSRMELPVLRTRQKNIGSSGPAAGDVVGNTAVADDLPDVIPISVRELEVIETYLWNLIEPLLANGRLD